MRNSRKEDRGSVCTPCVPTLEKPLLSDASSRLGSKLYLLFTYVCFRYCCHDALFLPGVE